MCYRSVSMGQESRHSLAESSALGVIRRQSRSQPGCILICRLQWGRSRFHSHSGGWQSSFLCSCRTEDPCILLAGGWRRLSGRRGTVFCCMSFSPTWTRPPSSPQKSVSPQEGISSYFKGFHLIKSGPPTIICFLINSKSTRFRTLSLSLSILKTLSLNFVIFYYLEGISLLLLRARGRGSHKLMNTWQQKLWRLLYGLSPELSTSTNLQSAHKNPAFQSLLETSEYDLVALGPHASCWQQPAGVDYSQPSLKSTCRPEFLLLLSLSLSVFLTCVTCFAHMPLMVTSPTVDIY